MPLPEKLMENLSRTTSDTPGWSGQLLMFSSTIFFVALAVYFGLIFGYKPYLESKISDLDSQIKNFGIQIPVEEQNKLVYFYSQVINLQNILSHHISSSQVFTWLEKNTEQNVYFDRFNWDSTSGGGKNGFNQINLAGYSKTTADFSRQLLVFQNDPLVKRVIVGSFSLFSNNMWRFDVTLYIDNSVLSQTQTNTAGQ